MSARSRQRRQRDQPRPAEVTWGDVLDRVGVELRDLDWIRSPELWSGGEEDDGAPASVYANPSLFRAWVAVNAPERILDEAGALVNAQNRTLGAVVAAIRKHDGKVKVTPALALELLELGKLSLDLAR
jgi:hypothetical protein